jgi:glycosyltransferase involved in cell wall biosynthesis
MLNVFYEEPDGDRWLPFDRYPRRMIRRLVRGKPRPGGQSRVFLNLCAGLDRIGTRYRINDYGHAKSHPRELVCIIGKPYVLDKIQWKNPILFGAAVNSHPIDDLRLLERLPVRKILVPGPWMKDMCEPYWGGAIRAWPVGIDTDLWRPSVPEQKIYDVLLYDKVRWKHEHYNSLLLDPIREVLRKNGHTFLEMRYGYYCEEDFLAALSRCRTMIFLCEHETQGIAYQQALSCGVPILAWDRGGPWQDPAYFPDKVVFEPVTSVPYWDERCGRRFTGSSDFEMEWNMFWDAVNAKRYRSRDYILEHLTLEKCAWDYLNIVDEVLDETR